MKKILLIVLILFFNIYSGNAHVGNLNTTLEGMAGPYHLLINIKVPPIIPGQATLTLFTTNQPGIKIYARPIYFLSGAEAAPNPDLLTRVANQPGQYEGSIWLMNKGSASIEIIIEGPLGKGKMLVPVVAVSTTNKKLPASTAYLLTGLGIFLFILMITIVGASASDALTKKGEPITTNSKRSKRIALVIAVILCTGLLYGGNRWWKSVASKTSKLIFKPMHANYNVVNDNGVNVLQLTVDTTNAQRSKWLPYIIPDHGKIMHMFLVSLPDMKAFAHIHPSRTGLINFSVDMPDLPDGKYLAYADIVYNSGFTETLKDTITITRSILNYKADSTSIDNDDAIDISHPASFDKKVTENENITIGNKTGEVYVTNDGTKILLKAPKKDKYYFSGELERFEFSLWDKNNQPLAPDLYMGMQGHLIIVRDDGNVFSHVHPVGTYSMAAQTRLQGRINNTNRRVEDPDATAFRDSIDLVVKKLQAMPENERENFLMNQMTGMTMMNMNMSKNNMVSFPYTFETPGNYRIWMQFKKNAKVYTGVFDRIVK